MLPESLCDKIAVAVRWGARGVRVPGVGLCWVGARGVGGPGDKGFEGGRGWRRGFGGNQNVWRCGRL